MRPFKQLPSNPSLRQLRNQAKDLHQAYRAGEPNAIRRIGDLHPRFSGSSQAEIAAAEIVLADAQLVIARELGFDSWPKLNTHIESLSSRAPSGHELVTDSRVEEAIAEIEKLGGRCKLGKNGQVRAVTLTGPSLSDTDLACLKRLPGIEVLDLAKTRVSDAGLENLKGLTSLKRLSIISGRVTDAGLENLTGLTKLEKLYLFRLQVGDAGLRHLEGLANLTELYLNRTRVADAGMKYLKGLTRLHTLGLGRTRVSDAGLGQLTGLPSLERLYLNHTQVTDVGLERLKELANLEELSLRCGSYSHRLRTEAWSICKV